ncbi:hypothetical protein [Actinocorallia sp. A-T 12471]|uniref:hypothetical protein n=1 Tax=Actinocorallia sp. A-T 12471 TaxID=3089813 RepID=UPI0029D34B12|nr:hypothetical protein [Actinocorallia sp. A-T 12471]MDX6745064.1 hypothetical protein [Actinocorallia sp. A-T 12471]
MRSSLGVVVAVVLGCGGLTGCAPVPLAPDGRPGDAVIGLGAALPYLPSGPPLAGPRRPLPVDVYAAKRPEKVARALRTLPKRLFVPHGRTVTVLAQRDLARVRRIRLAAPVARVVPSWDLGTLWAFGPNALVPLNPRTLRPGRPRPLSAARDLVFTPDGTTALLLTARRLEYRDPTSMALHRALLLPCAPTSTADFTADGDRLVTSCGTTLLFLDWRTGMSGTSVMSDAPTRLLLSPDGSRFYAATPSGLLVLDATSLQQTSRITLNHPITTLLPAHSTQTIYASGPGTLTPIPPNATPTQTLPLPHNATLSALSPHTLYLRTPTSLTTHPFPPHPSPPTHTTPLPNTDLTLHPHPSRYPPTPHPH